MPCFSEDGRIGARGCAIPVDRLSTDGADFADEGMFAAVMTKSWKTPCFTEDGSIGARNCIGGAVTRFQMGRRGQTWWVIVRRQESDEKRLVFTKMAGWVRDFGVRVFR